MRSERSRNAAIIGFTASSEAGSTSAASAAYCAGVQGLEAQWLCAAAINVRTSAGAPA